MNDGCCNGKTRYLLCQSIVIMAMKHSIENNKWIKIL